ncbi:MAG: ATP-binding cassette domain-containing protein [Actinomycetota bacterium]|nr:ATP-binding cassette domain-containing protein [Actinomycetota bacterium]
MTTAGGLRVRLLRDGSERSFDGSRPVSIGRDEAADVTIRDPRASRLHATLEPADDGHWWFQDRSSHGTFRAGAAVGRFAVAGPVTLNLGDAANGEAIVVLPGQATAGPNPAPAPAATPVPDPPPSLMPATGPPTGIGAALGGEFSSVYEPAAQVRIGRAPDNDVVINDLLVSRHHAELRAGGQSGFQIVDLQSHNGTYVNGERVHRAAVAEGSAVAIGHHLFRLIGGRLEEYIDTGRVSFAAMGLSVVTPKGKVLLDDVSFALDASSFLAVLGPTGAGKTTLLRALTGSRPADRGQVLYNGRDVYATYAELRNRIGYVPQDDILHPQLTVERALSYAARLRFPPDVSDRDRQQRVAEVMAELGLTERANLAVAQLSGGQRKRTSVAIELLTRPSLLFLDEPTSGLDPGYEKSVMELLRSLADGGRTVITVTHSIQSLDRCDRILFLAPGGQTAFFGPPRETLGYFAKAEYAEVFQQLDHAAPGQAKAAFTASGQAKAYVDNPIGSLRGAQTGGGGGSAEVRSAPDSPSWGHQYLTLLRRYLAVTVADRRNTLLLLLQAPILGVLMLTVLGHGHLADGAHNGEAGTALLALVLGATYLGAGNSIREIVKERGILTRERSVGLSPSAYLLSKATVLGVLTVAQAAVMVTLGVARQSGPSRGLVFPVGRIELVAVVAMTGLAAMALGLAISALVSNPDKALTLLPVVLFAEFLLSGAAFNVAHTPVLSEISYATSAHWGFSAAAATANLDAIQGSGCNGSPAPPAAAAGHRPCDGTHRHATSTWVLDMSVLGLLIIVPLVSANLTIHPIGQPRRR